MSNQSSKGLGLKRLQARPRHVPAAVVAGCLLLTACGGNVIRQGHQFQEEDLKQVREGMTKEQADEIVKELKAIHQLLERQQAASQAALAANSDKVQMSVVAGWYAIGRDDAPITIVEFADYQCPFCRKFHSDTFAELKKNYIDTGKVRFVSRDLPLDSHPNASGAAIAARCVSPGSMARSSRGRRRARVV